MKKKFIALLLSFTLLGTMIPAFMTASAEEPILAFPGADGAGKYATGGRGGTVYHVTNLNDSGTGSFRDAVSGSNRIIVFDVGGTIELKSDVSVKGNNTIAGQTAPGGGGVTLKGGKIGMAGENIIIRYVSSRPGENGSSECDAWGGSKGSNSVIDHCSIGWANDEQFGLYSDLVNLTVQYSIVGPANCISYHSKGAHGFGIMMGAANNTWHHNMIAHNISRNFRGKMGGTLDYVNNVIFNWGYQTAYGTFGQVNYVGNYFKKGLSTNGGYKFININSGTAPEKYRFYLAGNKMVNEDGTEYDATMNADNWQGGIDYGNAGLTQENYQVTTPLVVSDVYGNDASIALKAQTADEAFETVLAYAGAGISSDTRPKIDKQIMEEARTGNGYLTGGRDFSTLTSSDTALNEAIEKYNIKEMNYDEYYPTPVTQTEITDTDNDGMSDDWEMARGLDPSVNDATGDYLGQGYNNIEYYINDLTVDSFPEGVVTVSPETVDLGEDYRKAKEDADAIKLSPTSIKEVGDLILPTECTNNSDIQWSSSSSAIVIADNKITAVNRPSVGDASVTLTAILTNGEVELKRSFNITVRQLPYNFDFGNSTVQSGFVAVTDATVYSADTGFGFVGDLPEAMERAPENITSGLEDLHADQVHGVTEFKADVPNGKYLVTIHYGSWNTGFGTNYTVEGISSGALYSTDAAQYTTKVEITDGALDVAINKSEKSYGGYINGIEIMPLQKFPYHFDFGDGALQSGYIAVTSSTLYSELTEYGFDGTALEGMARAPVVIESGYENLYNDQLLGEGKFKTNVPNGKYEVVIHYGTWNTGFGTTYTVEGVSSGALYSTDAAQYSTTVEVTDGMLDVDIAKGTKSYGGYISGMDVIQITPTPSPTVAPTAEPTATPTVEPTATPTVEPTATPTTKPEETKEPTETETPLPESDYRIAVSYETSENSITVKGEYIFPNDTEVIAILAVYDENGALISVKVEELPLRPIEIAGITDGYIAKGMLWKKDTLQPVADVVSVVIE